jgi:AcrR family transcriptional regulator
MAKIKSTKKATKKEVIAIKAASLFKAKGFNATSMRELADLVGVEASSLYNHIGSKSELLHSICFKIANEFTVHLDQVENSNGNSVKKLQDIISFHIRIMLKKFDEVFVANHEWKHLQEPYLSNFLNQRRSYEKRLIAIVSEGIKNKEIINGEPQIIIFTILSAVRGLELWHRNKKNISEQKLEESMIAQLTTGFIK